MYLAKVRMGDEDVRFGFYCFYRYCVLYLGALLRVSVCLMLCLSAVF